LEAPRHDVTKKILLIGGICLALAVGALVCLFVAFFVSMERGEKHQRQIREEQRSGEWDFGDQPALFAVAQAIVKNLDKGAEELSTPSSLCLDGQATVQHASGIDTRVEALTSM
jgi:sensor domain CHASE-containing protein